MDDRKHSNWPVVALGLAAIATVITRPPRPRPIVDQVDDAGAMTAAADVPPAPPADDERRGLRVVFDVVNTIALPKRLVSNMPPVMVRHDLLLVTDLVSYSDALEWIRHNGKPLVGYKIEKRFVVA